MSQYRCRFENIRAPPTNVGMTMKVRMWYTVSTFAGGGTLSLTAYADATQIFTIDHPAAVAAKGCLTIDIQPRGGNYLQTLGSLVVHGQNAVVNVVTTNPWPLGSAH